MKIRFQSLLSNSTCAATPRLVGHREHARRAQMGVPVPAQPRDSIARVHAERGFRQALAQPHDAPGHPGLHRRHRDARVFRLLRRGCLYKLDSVGPIP